MGLYILLVVAYIRPQDFYPILATFNPARWVLIVSFIAFVAHQFISGKKWVKAGQNIALLALLFLIFFSRLYAIDMLRWEVAAEDFLRICLAYFMIVNLVNTPRKLKLFYLFFIFINLFVGLRFYIAYKTGTAVYSGSKPGDASFGFLSNADDLGIGMAVLMPFALIPIFYAKNIFWKGLSVLGSLAFMLAVLGTHSRAAAIGVITVFLAAILSQMKWKRLTKNQYAIGMVIVLMLFSGFVYKYRYTLEGVYTSAQTKSDPGRVGREATWAAGRQMVKDRPILGVGRGSYLEYWKRRYPPGEAGYQVAHNIFLEVAAELGIVGLLLFLFFAIYGVKEARSIARRYKGKLDQHYFYDMLFTIYIVALIAFCVNGFFITVAFYWHIYILVALFVCTKSIFLRQIAYEKEK
ncbi:O-antigen ligase family protein [Candidatus Omnitrophota bacterium]